MLVVNHAVGNDRRKERFNRRQERDGERGHEQVFDVGEIYVNPFELGERIRNVAEARVDCLRFPAELRHRKRGEGADENRADLSRNALAPRQRPVDDYEHREQPDEKRGNVRRADCLADCDALGNEVFGHFVDLQPEKVLHLRGHDEDCDAVCEAHYDGARNVADCVAHFRNAHHDEEDARKERRHRKRRIPVLPDDSRHDYDERASRAADLDFRAAEDRDYKARDNRRVDALFGRDAACYAERHCQREGEDSDAKTRAQVGGENGTVIALHAVEHFGAEREFGMTHFVRSFLTESATLYFSSGM